MKVQPGSASPASAAGILYQFERALLQLALAPANTAVGLEALDDIAVKSTATGDVLAVEQDKHSISEAGYALGDRSEALWKTLKNWLHTQQTSTKPIHTFTFVTNQEVKPSLLKRIGRYPKTSEEISDLLAEVRAAGEGSSISAIDELIAAVNASDDETLSSLIAKVQLLDASNGGSAESIRQQLTNALLIPIGISAQFVIDALAGWLQRTVIERWRKKETAWIERAAFVEAVDAAKRHYLRRKQKRERAATLVPVTAEEITSESSSAFVHHLILIDADEELIEHAIIDYLRFSKEKFRLLEEGMAIEDDFSERGEELVQRWDGVRLRHKRSLKTKKEEDVGHDIYDETVDFKCDLGGDPTYETYLTSGQYHRLANDDRVHWHPRYQQLPASGAA